MTMELFDEIIKDNNIPKDVCLRSDSGWEGSATEMDGVYYNRKKNIMVFTQGGMYESDYHGNGWEVLHFG